MADEKRPFSEEEHLAILGDRVAKETAELNATVETLTSEKSELATKLDVAESAKTAAEQRALDAEKALEDFKAEVNDEREAASRQEARVTELRENAKHLDDAFFTDEDRVKRIVAMSDEQFAGYVADLSSVAPTAKPPAAAPRETAMHGAPVKAPESKGSAAHDLLFARYATKEA